MPSPQHRGSKAGLTIAATVSGMLRAQILKSKLEQAGIAVLLDYESAALLFGITADGLPLSQVRLLVADEDVEAAKGLLETPVPADWEEDLPLTPDT